MWLDLTAKRRCVSRGHGPGDRRSSIVLSCAPMLTHSTGGCVISHHWVEIRIDEHPHSGNAFKQSLLFVNDPMVPRGMERLDGEWLGRMWCAAMCCH